MADSIDRSADIIDRAADLTEQINSAHVSQARAKGAPEQVQNPDGTWPHPQCVDCEDVIPDGRLKLGRIRCISCQEDKEADLRRRLRG